jgi:hypothetical protein
LTTEKELAEKDKDGTMREFHENHKDEIYDREEDSL